MAGRLERLIVSRWYAATPGWCWLLWPLSWLVGQIAARRLRRFRQQHLQPPVPVLVVGNVTVGGTGKTPLVIALCQALAARGKKVVVISRGHRARAPAWPFVVTVDSHVAESGDEPLLLALRTGVPVVIDADRRRALEHAVATFRPDLVISDDGLQHYRLPRSMELVVVDGARGLGNGLCLPAGPLREAATRLDQVDRVVINGDGFDFPGALRVRLVPDRAVNLATGEQQALADLAGMGEWDAVAGIGNPERFFATLEQAGLVIHRHVFADHHAFAAQDLDAGSARPVIMTEKDAVKCRGFAGPAHWYLPVSLALPDTFVDELLHRLTGET